MLTLKLKRGRIFLLAAVFGLLLTFFPVSASAEGLDDYSGGTYELNATLTCYVNAMGGIEFGAPLLTGSIMTVDGEGNATMTLTFTKSSVTIYSVTCDTFIDPAPAFVTDDRGVESGTIGYYDEKGVLQTDGVTYTISDDTAPNPSNDEVHYVDSITFPLDSKSDTYGLTFYINSNVMGVQFCNANDVAAATSTATYPATLTVDWSGAAAVAGAAEDTAGEDASGGTVVSEDGLNIHYADGAENDAAAETDQEGGYTFLLNTLGFLIAAIVAGVILIAGVILVVLSSRAKKRVLAGKDPAADIPETEKNHEAEREQEAAQK